MTDGLPTFTVVVPALNEEENLRPTVESILKEIGPLASDLEVLVFNDASTDRTGAVANELAAQDSRVQAIHNAQRLNIGGSYKAGLARARGEYFLLVPGDNETRVDEIARGLAFVGRADLILFHVTNPRVRGTTRRLLSRLYVLAVNLMFGTRVRYTNGTNVFRTGVLRRVPIRTNGFSYQTEAVVKAVRSGVDYVQVGLEIKARDTGTSKAVTWKNVRSVAGALGRLWWDVMITHRAAYRGRGRALRAS
jgi:glycosyltransferase involved in cell wall biosynthesis